MITPGKIALERAGVFKKEYVDDSIMTITQDTRRILRFISLSCSCFVFLFQEWEHRSAMLKVIVKLKLKCPSQRMFEHIPSPHYIVLDARDIKIMFCNLLGPIQGYIERM
jgi:hypothetical protein